PAFGGNARVMFLEDRSVKLGVSSYQGAWSPDGKHDFTMLNAYLAAERPRWSLLAEGLRTNTDGDRGVEGAFGSREWTSSGAFMEGAFYLQRQEDRFFALLAGTEETVAKGKGAGALHRERLIQHKGGAAWRLNPNVLLKLQAGFLFYQVPIQIL